MVIICRTDDDKEICMNCLMKFDLQALSVPRYSFRHSLQTQTLAVHMRPGAAALVWATSHRGSAHQQRKRQSPNLAGRSPLLRHDIHTNYLQIDVNWKSEGESSRCGNKDPESGQERPFDCVVELNQRSDGTRNQISSQLQKFTKVSLTGLNQLNSSKPLN